MHIFSNVCVAFGWCIGMPACASFDKQDFMYFALFSANSFATHLGILGIDRNGIYYSLTWLTTFVFYI